MSQSVRMAVDLAEAAVEGAEVLTSFRKTDGPSHATPESKWKTHTQSRYERN